MAAECEAPFGPCASEPRDIFFNAVKFVLGNWPAVRLSVEQGFGGQYSREKERWLEEIIFSLFLENEGVDPLDVEDYLAEILSNEFNVIIEDDSLPKVSQKLCNYYQSCKNGEHSSVAAEIMSVKLPKMNVKCDDSDADTAMESAVHDEVAGQLEDLNLAMEEPCSSAGTSCEENTSARDMNGLSNWSDKDEAGKEEEGWMVVQRSKKKR